jgi:KaiC/GvpD/RAD55 family RecA-like ATPase
MGLLSAASKKRGDKLKKLTKEKKKYIDAVSNKRRDAMREDISKQRRVLEKKFKGSVGKTTSGGLLKLATSMVSGEPLKKLKLNKTSLLKSIESKLSKVKKSKTVKFEKIKEVKQALKDKKVEKIPEIFSDMSSIKSSIEKELMGERSKTTPKGVQGKETKKFMWTGVPGFDSLLDQGIPKGSSILMAGGAGSGKTILCLQTLMHHAKRGKKCLMMSFEESEDKLISHMEAFGWNPRKYIKEGKLLIKRFNPFEITRSVDALLMEAKGELLIDVQPVIFPGNFKPDLIVVDSLTAIASAFTKREDSYRIYIEQLFRFFEKVKATSFLITETEQVPKIFSTSGVEEFLADGVVVLYNIKRGNIRERALEILKLRGASHQHKIVAMNITTDGVDIYPEQEIFGGIESGQGNTQNF